MRDSTGRLLKHQAVDLLDWDNFTANITPTLLELFKVYAVSWKVLEKNRIPTVSRSYHTMCKQQRGHSRWDLCSTKVQEVIDEIKDRVLNVITQERYQEIYDSV